MYTDHSAWALLWDIKHQVEAKFKDSNCVLNSAVDTKDFWLSIYRKGRTSSGHELATFFYSETGSPKWTYVVEKSAGLEISAMIMSILDSKGIKPKPKKD